MDREDTDRTPEIVAAADYVTGVIPLARPGVVVWLDDDAPDTDEVTRAAAMRAHPARGAQDPPDEAGADDDTDPDGADADEGPAAHLRAVS